ncbi:MAG: sigma-70 family RNA polymerase sigma factor [Myxococcales bacterium]|nr:sigma-70 family RNA polymerase sigma factor [Myxococcales bacterium]
MLSLTSSDFVPVPPPARTCAAWWRGGIVEGEQADLVERAQRGDRAAWDLLLRRHREDVLRIAFRHVGPSGDLEDVVQEALIQVYRSLHTFKGQARFSTWLYRVVSNVAKMHLRAKGSRPRLAEEFAQRAPRVDTHAARGDDAAERMRRARALYAQLDRLSEKKREVLLLHDFDGLSPKDIAERVDAPIMTVRTRLFYARRDLYRAMASDPELQELYGELGELRRAAGQEGGQ